MTVSHALVGARLGALTSDNSDIVSPATLRNSWLPDDAGQVLEQYTWEPHGEPAAINRVADEHPNNRVGHQGLLFERLDATDPDDIFPRSFARRERGAKSRPRVGGRRLRPLPQPQ